MTQRIVEQALRDVLRKFVRKLPSYPALLGDGVNDDVTIAGWPGWVWARVGSDEVLERVYNNRVPNRADLPVIVGYDPVQPKLFQVLSIREIYAGAGTGQAQIPQIPPHGYTHQWPSVSDTNVDGSDPVYAHWRQIRGLRVVVTSGFTVAIGAWPMVRNGQLVVIDEQSLDLDDDVPAEGTGCCVVRLYVDENGIFSKEVGAVFSEAEFDFETAAPVGELGQYTLAYVLLKDDYEELKDDSTRQDITDGRWPPDFSAAMNEDVLDDHVIPLIIALGG